MLPRSHDPGRGSPPMHTGYRSTSDSATPRPPEAQSGLSSYRRPTKRPGGRRAGTPRGNVGSGSDGDRRRSRAKRRINRDSGCATYQIGAEDVGRDRVSACDSDGPGVRSVRGDAAVSRVCRNRLLRNDNRRSDRGHHDDTGFVPALVVPLQEVGADGFPISALLDLEGRVDEACAADVLLDPNAALFPLSRAPSARAKS